MKISIPIFCLSHTNIPRSIYLKFGGGVSVYVYQSHCPPIYFRLFEKSVPYIRL